jgi:hypothetical protein
VIRTVERVSFIDRNTVRRRVARHFKLPEHEAARPIIDGRCVLPVFSIPKGTFISCDLRDAGDRRIALPPIEERWHLTFCAVMALLRKADPSAESNDDLRTLLRNVVEATHHSGDAALRELNSYTASVATPALGHVLARSEFKQLTNYLSKNFLVFADIDPDPIAQHSHIISYLIDRRFPNTRQDFDDASVQRSGRRLRKLAGLAPHSYFHSWPITGAGSSHLEIQAPGGVDFGERELQLPNRDKTEHSGTSTQHARFLAPRTTAPGEGYTKIRVYPGTGVMRKGGPAVAALFTILVLIVAASDLGPTSATALLLILPSFASVVAARPNEHPYVTRVVQGVRFLTLAPIPLGALATASVVAGWPRAILWAIVAASLVATLTLVLGVLISRARPRFTELVLDDLTRVA